jgi:uroporphyrinogen-III decarboxylase
LIEKVGRGGGLILDAACGIPDEAKPENVRAMFEAARKYGA